MTRKLEELFDFPPADEAQHTESTAEPPLPTTRETLQALDEAIDKVDAALPAVQGLDASDRDMDELADLAKRQLQQSHGSWYASRFKICQRNIQCGQQHAGPCYHCQNSQTRQKTQDG